MSTPIANIPEIAASQTNKYLIHNEALRHIEALALAAVETTITSPPSNPAIGQTWIVGLNASGAWVGRDNAIAQWQGTGWFFYQPFAGLSVPDKLIQGFKYFNGTTWIVMTGSGGSSLSLSDGTTAIAQVDNISISGATLTNQGNGDALITIPTSNLTVTNGTSTVNSVDLISFPGSAIANNGNGDISVTIPVNPLLTVVGDATTVTSVDKITFSGATVTNDGNGDVSIAIASNPTLTLIQGVTTVTSVDQLSITGATLTNQGNGDALLAIPTSNLSITNGTSTVSNVDSINFSGATLTNQGSGDITIAIPTSNPLTVIGGATTVTSVDKITFTGATVTNDGNGDTTVAIANSLSVTNGTTTVSNTTSISFSNATITNSGGGVATVTLGNSSAFQSSVITYLPYTLAITDQYKELVVTNGTGNFSIPLTTATFPVGWQCTLSLDGTGNINIQRSDNSYTNLVFSGGEPRLKTQGSVTLVHRGSNVWKVIGYLQA
jgi:hypothetical protein